MANPLGDVLTTLGGTQTTTNAGNIDPLVSVLSQLQASNASSPEAIMASLFQAASGQIPGFQQAFGNTMGARSRGNSAINASLQKLLQQTTLAGQSQIAQQQNQNLQTQGQVAGAIANATKGTNQQTGTNLGNAAQNMAILKLLSESGILKKGGLSNLFGGTDTGAVDMAGFNTPSAPISYEPAANAPTPFASVDPGFTQDYTQMFNDSSIVNSPSFDTSGWDIPMEQVTYEPTQQDLVDYGQYYADGGLIQSTPAGAKKSEAKPPTTLLDVLHTLAKNEGKTDKPATEGKANFADGGSVTQYAAGGRRTSAQTIELDPIAQMLANNTQAPAASQQITLPTTQTPEFASAVSTGNGNKGAVGGFNAGMGPGGLSEAGKRNFNIANSLNTLSSVTGGPSAPAGAIGLFGGLMNAKTPQDALGVAAKTAINMVAPQAVAAYNLATNPTMANTVDAGLSFTMPGVVANALMGLADSSLGTVVENLKDMISPNQMMTDDQRALVAAEQAGSGAGSLGGVTGDRGPGGSSGDTGAAAGGATAAGPGGYADGGNVAGISDKIDIKVSPGEFVISKDVVDAVGVDFFNLLQQALHTPAAVQRAAA